MCSSLTLNHNARKATNKVERKVAVKPPKISVFFYVFIYDGDYCYYDAVGITHCRQCLFLEKSLSHCS